MSVRISRDLTRSSSIARASAGFVSPVADPGHMIEEMLGKQVTVNRSAAEFRFRPQPEMCCAAATETMMARRQTS